MLGHSSAALALNRYGHDASEPGSTEAQAAIDAFIGFADSGDRDWASQDIHELRSEAAARSSPKVPDLCC